MSLDLKIECYQRCQEMVAEDLEVARAAVADAQDAANGEEKSSAGDKYETGRAMMQRERDQALERLAPILEMVKTLSQLKPNRPQDKAELGSLVQTQDKFFFLSVPLGKVKLGDRVFWAISPVSPVGSLLLDRRKGDRFSFNGRDYEVLGVW